MALSAHRVRRQAWRVRARSAQQAFAVRAYLRTGVEQELRQVMEHAFDGAASGEAVLHIPRLEMHLRVSCLHDLAEALAGVLARELPRRAPQLPLRRERGLDQLQMLLEYLDTGMLPWHAAHAEVASIASELRVTLLAHLPSVVRRRASSFEHAVEYYFRVLQLVPEAQWTEAAASIATEAGCTWPLSEVFEIRAVLDAVDAAGAEPAALKALAFFRQLPQVAIATLLAAQARLRRHQLLRVAAAVLAVAGTPVAAEDSRSFARTGRTPGAASPTAEQPFDALLPESREGFLPEEGQIRELCEPAKQPFALMVANAGLVLLHPFLARLFETCGFLKGQELAKREAAAALLYWLATGRDEALELELGVVKLLVGLRPEEPLALAEGLLGAREHEEGEALLAAAIDHWQALGRTSADGLRVTFLQRHGALRDEEAGWRVQPEMEGFDVLLRHLPWGLAMVRLPWMTRPLYTDWHTP